MKTMKTWGKTAWNDQLESFFGRFDWPHPRIDIYQTIFCQIKMKLTMRTSRECFGLFKLGTYSHRRSKWSFNLWYILGIILFGGKLLLYSNEQYSNETVWRQQSTAPKDRSGTVHDEIRSESVMRIPHQRSRMLPLLRLRRVIEPPKLDGHRLMWGS